MDSCGCDDAFAIFDRATAEGDRDRYWKHGPDRTTRLLLELLEPYLTTGSTLLDIGGGIGVIDHELIRSGVGHAVLVDASTPSLEVARSLAGERGTLDRLDIVEGDFVHRAGSLEAADLVTLDRVVCCYPAAEALVSLAAARTRRALGLVLPNDGMLVRLGIRLINLTFRIRRRAYRSYAHRNAEVDGFAARHGLRPIAERATWFWRVVVFTREGTPSRLEA
jgi:magnesium-protoporphyrin O-methyltransferase